MLISWTDRARNEEVNVKFSRLRPSTPLWTRKVKAMKVVRSSPLRTGRLYPQEYSRYSFLEAEEMRKYYIQKEDRNILHKIQRRKANFMGHILR